MAQDNVAWDIDSVYQGFASAEYQGDLAMVKHALEGLAPLCSRLAERIRDITRAEQTDIHVAVKASEISAQANTRVGNLFCYLTCFLTTDPASPAGLQAESDLRQLAAKFSAMTASLNQYLLRCPDGEYSELLKNTTISDSKFYFDRARKQIRPHLLPLNEEELLCALESSGHSAWEQLWETLSGTGQCTVDFGDRVEKMGLAKAASLLRHPREDIRRAAYEGRQIFWETHKEAAAAAINHLAGWRTELYRRLGHNPKNGFLMPPTFSNSLEIETVDTVLKVAKSERSLTQESLRDAAALMGKSKLDPWDHSAPPPASILSGDNKTFTFGEGLKIVKEAFGAVHGEFADFVDMMYKNRWIESRVLEKKRGGAFSIWFPKARQPRIMQTYNGSMDDVRTLAHELGHAFHSWCLRDLPEPQQSLPNTLAETASNFAEACVAELLDRKDPQGSDAKAGLWMDLTSGAAYTLDIPARFCFEREIYALRDSKRWGPAELSEACARHFGEWFGSAVSEVNPLFWASKGHFYISGSVSFYNFPYIIGYLLSLAIFNQRKSWGSEFFVRYRGFLMDTGRMTVEEIVKHHLNDDAYSESFWKKAFSSHNDICQKFQQRFFPGKQE